MNHLIKNNKYDNLVNSILYCAFFIHQLFFLLSVSALSWYTPQVRKATQAVIIISFVAMGITAFYYLLRGRFSIKEIVIYLFISIPLLISLYNYRVVMVISNLLYAAIFKNADAKKSLRIALYATVAGFLINIALSIFTTYTGNAIQSYPNGSPRYRYGLGFYYAYITAYYFLTIVIMFILAYDKFSYLLYIILIALNIIIFKLTDTKAACFYAMIAIALHFIFVKLKCNKLFNLFKPVAILSCPISVLLAILFPIFYVEGNSVWDFLNQVVNGRLRLTQKAFEVCGWTLFGQTAPIWGYGKYYVDSAIGTMFVQNGLIVLIMAVIFMTFFSYMAIKINHKPLAIVLFIISIRSIFDLGFMTMQLGPVIILFYDVLRKYRSGVVCDY